MPPTVDARGEAVAAGARWKSLGNTAEPFGVLPVVITITERAASKVHEFMSDDEEAQALRIAVQGGGCSGFQYALGFDSGPQDGDEIIEAHGVMIVVDPFSMPYVRGSEIDFVETLNETGFKIENPNVVAGCGCGSSFQVKDEDGEPAAAAGGCSSCG